MITHPAPSAGDIAGRLDRLAIGPFHRRLALAIGAGLFVDGFDLYLAAGVAGALLRQGMADLHQLAILSAATVVGLGLGGLCAGTLADRLGRRRAMQGTLAIVLFGSIGAALAADVTQLTVWRLFTALGLGGETVLGYALLSEFLPPGRRGRWLAWLGLAANIGMPLALLTGSLILPLPDGWRWMLALPAAAAIPVLLLRLRMVESPRWLAVHGRLEEADAIVTAIERQSAQGEPAPVTASMRAAAPSRPSADALWRRLLVGSAVNIGIVSAVFGFVSWLPSFFASEGLDVASSALFAGIISLGNPAGVLLALLVIDRVERKWGFVLSALGASLLGAGYALAAGPAAVLVMGFLVVTTVYFAGTLGLTAYVPELFATSFRMRGVGICATAGRVVAFILPFIVVPVFTLAGQAGVIAMIGVILAVQAGIVAALGVASSGRPLESV